MRTKAMFAIVIIVAIVTLTGCFFRNANPLPIYERELNDQDGIVVTVEGVEYKVYPELKWRGQRIDVNEFGFAGSKKHVLHYCENDSERNFIFVWDEEFQPLGELHEVLLYRTDREIPAPSSDSVNKLLWQENNYRGDETVRNSQWINNKETIEMFFDEMKANRDTRVNDAESFDHFSMNIYCYSELVPGARYEVWFGHVNGKLMVGNYFEGFVEFSPEVWEQIAGHEIDLEALIAGK